MENNTYNIAIIDDELEILRMLEKYFSKTGKYKVTTYSNPLLAIDSFSKDKYDLVLLDIMMPQIGGLEVLEKLVEIDENVRVCMMTAYSTLDKVLKSHKEGATNYVMKPFSSLQALEDKIQKIISK